MKIGIIYTGGTIGSLISDQQSLSPMEPSCFESAFDTWVRPYIQHTGITSISWLPPLVFSSGTTFLDSTDATPLDWCTLAAHILTHATDFDAFLILHGTDTLEYTASALSFLMCGIESSGATCHLMPPLVLTGSQYPLFEREHPSNPASPLRLHHASDAINNLTGAITAISQKKASGVSAYFGEQLLMGVGARKWHTTDSNGFCTPNAPSLPLVQNQNTQPTNYIDPLNLQRLLKQLAILSPHLATLCILPVKAVPAGNGKSINPLGAWLTIAVQQLMPQGMVLEGFGCGSFPSGHATEAYQGLTFHALQQAHQQGTIIVGCTQVPQGAVHIGTYASGAWLAQIGALDAGGMTSSCAYVKLLILLALAKARGWSQAIIETLFLDNWIGEFPDSAS